MHRAKQTLFHPAMSVWPPLLVLVCWVMGSHGPVVTAHAWPPAMAKEGDGTGAGDQGQSACWGLLLR